MLTRFYLIVHTFFLSLSIASVFSQSSTDIRGGKAETAPTNSGKSTAYGVVVGISTYQFLPSLRFADRDALVFADYLVRSAGVPVSQVETLINRQATLINLTDALTTVKKKIKSGDRVYVYFAGHGDIETRNDSTENAMLMLYGASRQDYNATFDKCYLREMKRWLDELTATGAEVVFVADACRSGAFALMGGQIGQSRTMLGLGKEWAGQVKILSCEPGELAIEGVEFGNGRGLFSYCLVDGLMGMADSDKDHVVTKSELEVYLKTTVPKTAKPHIQHPELLGGEGDMPIGTVNADSLRVYQKRKTRDYSLLTTTQTKGFEADLLRGQDSTTRRVYGLFEQALTARKLLHPTDQSALHYLRQFPARNNAKILGLMKRNLVAALQVRTEELLRPLLQVIRANEPTAPITKLDSAIAEMDTSIVLMGSSHNLIPNLIARRLFLEGKRMLISKRMDGETSDSLTVLAMSRFRESARLEPNIPYTYWEMSHASLILTQLDSMFFYLEKCRELVPNSSPVLQSLAQQYMLRHHLQKARICLEQARQIDPNDLGIDAELADISRQLGDESQKTIYRKKALMEYQRRNAGNSKREVLLDLVRLLKNTGQHDQAIKLIRILLKTDSTDAEAYLELSLIFSGQKKINESIAAIDQVIRYNPTFGIAHASRGYQYYNRYEITKQPADLHQANESAKESLRLNPGNFASLFVRCMVEFEYQNYRAALPLAQRAVRINPSIGELHLILGMIFIVNGDTLQARHSLVIADSLAPGNPITIQAWGLLANQKKDYVIAEKYFRKADTLKPNDPTNLAGLMKSLVFQKKNPDEILSLSQRLQKLTPTSEDAWSMAGYMYYRQKKYVEALPAFSEAFRLNPKNKETLKMIDEISSLIKQYKPAAEAYRLASDLDTTNVNYAFTAAKLFYIDRFGVKQNDEAFAMASRVVGIDTVKYPIAAQRDSIVKARLSLTYAMLGHISNSRNQVPQAINWYKKVILTDPNPNSKYMGPYHIYIGSAYFSMNHPDKAVPNFKEAVRLKPEDIEYHTMLTVALVRSGDIVAGEAAAKTLLRLDSVNVRGTQTLAVAVMRQNRYAEAWKLGQRLEKITPSTSWEAPYFYARWFARQGNIKEALLQLEKAFKLGFVSDAGQILTNPDFEPIKQDSGFINMVRTYCSDKK